MAPVGGHIHQVTVLLNEQQVGLRPPWAGPLGAFSRTGISFASQTLDGSLDGRPLGLQAKEAVKPTNGVFSFITVPGSISVLEYSTN